MHEIQNLRENRDGQNCNLQTIEETTQRHKILVLTLVLLYKIKREFRNNSLVGMQYNKNIYM